MQDMVPADVQLINSVSQGVVFALHFSVIPDISCKQLQSVCCSMVMIGPASLT